MFWGAIFVICICSISVAFAPKIAANDEDSLSSHDVLMIIARPLANDSEAGFYLIGAEMDGITLEYANLRGANLRGASFTYANLEGIDLRGADLSNTDFTGANLRFAKLNNANLANASLDSTQLFFAALSSANLRGADLTNAEFADTALGNAILPDGSDYQPGDDLVTRFGAASNPPSFTSEPN